NSLCPTHPCTAPWNFPQNSSAQPNPPLHRPLEFYPESIAYLGFHFIGFPHTIRQSRSTDHAHESGYRPRLRLP
ncbi:hypothetical protein TCAL_15464, partial [Tigriopus californicus]